jgi:uncharacterized membrane protein
MTTFTIDCDGNITAFASQKEAQAADIAGAEYFDSQEELAKLATAWPVSRLVDIWNGLPGVAPVKKFTDRKTALARIWKAAQALTLPAAPQGAPDAPKAQASNKKAASRQEAAPAQKDAKQAREGSKKAEVLELLRRPQGATLAEIQSLTRWAPHTIRGLVSTLGKKMKVESFKTPDGERAYRLS